MVKLSAELIEQAAQYTNPVRDRELDLRGWFVSPSAVLVSIARPAFVAGRRRNAQSSRRRFTCDSYRLT